MIVNDCGKWFWNVAKFFVGCFGGLTLHKTWQNTKGCYVYSYNWPWIEALWLCSSCIVLEDETKDVQGHGPSNINSLDLFVSFHCVCQAFYHFPLLTMAQLSCCLGTPLKTSSVSNNSSCGFLLVVFYSHRTACSKLNYRRCWLAPVDLYRKLVEEVRAKCINQSVFTFSL